MADVVPRMDGAEAMNSQLFGPHARTHSSESICGGRSKSLLWAGTKFVLVIHEFLFWQLSQEAKTTIHPVAITKSATERNTATLASIMANALTSRKSVAGNATLNAGRRRLTADS